MNFDRDIVSVE